MKKYALLLSLIIPLACSTPTPKATITGELKTWHNITLTFDGPNSSETASPNPFTDYRLQVVFTQGEQSFKIPGYFAADGQAAYSSADSGNKWRVHFSPPTTGTWTYQVAFQQGPQIAIEETEGQSAGFMDGLEGSFEVAASDKSGRDFRAHGRLQYVGEHYLQFEGSGQYFLKCGPDAPENLLAYYELDATPNVRDRQKHWEDHAQDYAPTADGFLWGKDKTKGKNILGAINYLAEKGLNAFSFLTFNIDGDDRNVFPHLLKVDMQTYQEASNEPKDTNQWEEMVIHDRFDVSKLDQWEQIFSYGESLGLFLHFKTKENENDQKMDGGEFGPETKLYYRELIARFAHHLALNWNICEETTQTIPQLKATADYIAKIDPYQNLIVLHTYPEQHDQYYTPLLGDQSALTGLSMQTHMEDFSVVHSAVKKWVKASAESGRKWVVSCDEPGDHRHSLIPDEEDPEHDHARINGLWGAFMAGGAGTEWYFGYEHPHSDLSCESWRTRDLFWNQAKIALDFFYQNNIPVQEMENKNELTESVEDYVLAKPGEVYLIYAKQGGNIELSLPDTAYQIEWFNPRTGEQEKIEQLTASNNLAISCPDEKDWLLYLHR